MSRETGQPTRITELINYSLHHDSFVTLLTPTPISLSYPMSGQQIDLSTAEFGKMLHEEIGWDDEGKFFLSNVFDISF